MTQQDDITQRVLTDADIEEIRQDWHCFFQRSTQGGVGVCILDIERRVLSKLRAPVAGQAQPVARIDNFGNVVMLTSDAPLNSYLHAAPQACAKDVRNAALEEAAGTVNSLLSMYVPVSRDAGPRDVGYINALECALIAIRALKQLQADKDAAPCTCPSGDGSLRHPCAAHPAKASGNGDEKWSDS